MVQIKRQASRCSRRRVQGGATDQCHPVVGIPNEIESSVTGLLVKVLVQDREPVEYGQPLITIEEQEEVYSGAR